MIAAYMVISVLVWGWLAWSWSSRNTQNMFFKLFLTGMTLWGIISLVHRIQL